jgi:hypothetical protein
MEAAMKASDGDEGDGKGDSGGGRATVTRVEGKGRWRGWQEQRWRRRQGWRVAKRARAARAEMATATRVAGGKEDKGVKEGNELFYS